MSFPRIIERTVSLGALAWRESLPGMVYQGEQNAHQFVIHCTKDGSPVTLTGSVLLKFLRQDGVTVDVPGSIVDGAATVTLSGNCYAVMGRAEITIFVTQDSATVAVYSANTAVTRTTGGEEISGGDIIDMPALQARFEEMGEAIEDCETATAAAEAVSSKTETLQEEIISVEGRVLNKVQLPNDFIYGRYLNNGFATVTSYARNRNAYPPGKYIVGPYAAKSFMVTAYISDTEGEYLLTNWVTQAKTIISDRPFYVSFAGLTGDSDLAAINAGMSVTRLASGVTLEGRVESAEHDVEAVEAYFCKDYSANRFDGAYTTGGYVYPGDGEIYNNAIHAYSSWIDISNGGQSIVYSNTHHASVNYSALRYAFYDANKTFISGAIGPTLQHDDTLDRDYTVLTAPTNAAYMRFSLPTDGFTLAPDIMIQYGQVTEYLPYTGDQTYIKDAALAYSPIVQKVTAMTYGRTPSAVSASTLSDGETLKAETNSIMKNQRIVFFAKIAGTFGGVTIGHGEESYGYYIKVDASHMTYGSNGGWGTAIAHGLTIADFVGVCIEVDVDLNVKTTITTAGGVFTRTQQINSSWRGAVFAKSMGASFTDVALVWDSDDYKCPLWAFGDSYFTLYSPTRWPYYVAKSWGYNNLLLNAYPGENSAVSYADLLAALEHGTPKYLLWCLGMNDPDSASAANASWVSTVQAIKKLCDAKGVELILTTIPNVTHTAYKNTYKNAWIEASGIRYVDFASALADVTGWLSSDNVHPSEIGGRFMALKLLTDVPEIMQGK